MRLSPSLAAFALALLLGLGPHPAPASATLAEFTFPGHPAQEQAFRDLIEQLRCLVCQNESLAASEADLAQDLRRDVYKMIRSGKTKKEVIAFLVARYGDFVLYKPPLKPSTYPLWYGPFALFGIAAFFLGRALLRKKKASDTQLSEAEQARLAALLSTEAGQPGSHLPSSPRPSARNPNK
jgi:cytochrome c-type biogenesis protein CcmH